MKPDRPQVLIWSSLISLFLVAVIGTLMRGYPFFAIPLPYEHWLHTHSHLAILGWVYFALLAGIRKSFLKGLSGRKHRWLVGSTILCVAGMAVSFPFQGYGGFSIAFSSLFLLATYLLIGFFLAEKGWRSNSLSGAFLRAGLLYLFLSSLFAWALGPIVAQQMKGEAIYRLAIYAYLHFQYNGWMSFALLGLFYRKMEEKGIPFDAVRARKGFLLLHIACIPAYALSTLWLGPHFSVYLIAASAAIAQLLALYHLFPSMLGFRKLLPKGWSWPVLILLLSFAAKLLLQALSAIPAFAELSAQVRDLVIAYLHLVLLGFVSFGLFGLFLHEGWLSRSLSSKLGLGLFLLAFLFTEGLIAQRALATMGYGSALPYIGKFLFGGTLLFPIAVLSIGVGVRSRDRELPGN